MSITDRQVGLEAMEVLQVMRFSLEELAQRHGLTPAQAFVLHTLAVDGQQKMRTVADKQHCDASNITGIVDKLLTGGFIERRECAEDRRVKYLTVSAKGRAALDDIAEALPARIGMDRLEPGERTSLHGLLAKLGAPA